LRLKSGGRPWVGGKDHSSHRLVGLGFSEKNAVLLLYGLSGVGALGAVGVYYAPSIIGLSLVFTLAVVAFGFGWFLDRKTPHKPLPKSLPHSPTIRAYSKTHAD